MPRVYCEQRPLLSIVGFALVVQVLILGVSFSLLSYPNATGWHIRGPSSPFRIDPANDEQIPVSIPLPLCTARPFYAAWARPVARLKSLWRAGKLDWHNVVLKGWQVRDTSITSAESDALRGLLGENDAGDIRDRGPLAKFSACSWLADKCMVHDSVRGCVLDELCGWCSSLGVCVSRFGKSWPELVAGRAQPVCAEGVLTVAAPLKEMLQGRSTADKWDLLVLNRSDATLGTVSKTDAGYAQPGRDRPSSAEEGCSVVITRAVPLRVKPGLPRIAFHFLRDALPDLVRGFVMSGVLFELSTHFWTPAGSPAPPFTEFFQAASDACIRSSDDLPLDVTVCYSRQRGRARLEHLTGGTEASEPADLTGELATWDIATRSVVSQSSAPDSASGVIAESASDAASKWGYRRGLAALIRSGQSDRDTDDLVRFVRHMLLGNVAWSNRANSIWPRFLRATFGLRTAPQRGALRDGHAAENAGTAVSKLSPLRLVLVSRRNKRVLLNEPELVAAATKRGLCVTVAVLEDLPLYSQVRRLAELQMGW